MTDDIEIRRRRAAYRACHRGTKEMDLILGRFAQARLSRMTLRELDDFERLLALPDPLLTQWFHEGGGPEEAALAALAASSTRCAAITDWRRCPPKDQSRHDVSRSRKWDALRTHRHRRPGRARRAGARPTRRRGWPRSRARHAAARRARRPPPRCAGARACLLRAAGAGDLLPRLGHRALRPRRTQCRHRGQAHRGARQAGLKYAQAPHRGSDDGQRRPSARAATRIPEARH